MTLVREARVDRYGIRMAIDIDGQPMKLEIVGEGRIDLVGADDAALPVARLSDEDLVAEKLLANEDRLWDDSALGRDVMDLLLLEHALGGLPAGAWEKARNAYGPSVESAWPRALERLRARPEQRRRAYEAMGVTAAARARSSRRGSARYRPSRSRSGRRAGRRDRRGHQRRAWAASKSGLTRSWAKAPYSRRSSSRLFAPEARAASSSSRDACFSAARAFGSK